LNKLTIGGVSDQDTVDSVNEEGEKIEITPVLNASVVEVEGRTTGMAEEHQTAETEQLMAAEGEERKTFAIKSVVNPADGTEISLQQAIMIGIIRPEEGVYVNSKTGETKPIASAMTEGLIKVHSSLCICARIVSQ